MAVGLAITGTFALLLHAALLTGAGADDVTTARCAEGGRPGRLRTYPADGNATVLRIHYCNLTNVPHDNFDGLLNLKFLYLDHNDISHLNPAAFGTMPKLAWLQLGYNKLRELPVLNSCTSLLELYLYNNLLTKIDNAETFSNCVKLQLLSLSKNNIEYLNRESRPLVELRALYLHDNQIMYISNYMFERNSKLDRLELQNNRLTFLPPTFVSKLIHAGASLKVSGNPWHCGDLLELVAEVRRAGVSDYRDWVYGDKEPQCKFVRDAGYGWLHGLWATPSRARGEMT